MCALNISDNTRHEFVTPLFDVLGKLKEDDLNCQHRQRIVSNIEMKVVILDEMQISSFHFPQFNSGLLLRKIGGLYVASMGNDL